MENKFNLEKAQHDLTKSVTRKQTYLTVLLLGLVATLLYAPMIGWGVPYATAPNRIKTFATDEILPLETLAEMHNTFIVSKPDRNYGYPWWHYFVVSAAQAPYVGYLLVTGNAQSLSPVYPFGFQDPVRALQVLTLIGRSVSVIMAAGVVIASYFFSRILWGHLTGIITALLTMVNYLMFYYARTGNLDVPLTFWSSIALVLLAMILDDGATTRRIALLGVFAGLAIATKDQALVLFVPLFGVLLAPSITRSSNLKSHFKLLLVGLATSVIAYAIGTGMVVDPQRHITHVYSLFFDQERLTTASAYFTSQQKTLDGIMKLGIDYLHGLAATMSLPVLLTAGAGVLLSLRKPSWRLFFLLPIPALFFMLNFPIGLVIFRYFLPLTMIVSAFAAHAVVSVRSSILRPAWIPLFAILLSWQILIGADLTYAQIHETRYAASDWLIEHAKPGDRVEHFGAFPKLPHLPVYIQSREVAGRTDWQGETGHGPYILDYLADNGPEYLLIIPDWTSQPGMDHSGDTPEEVYAALINGTAGYTQVAYFPPPSLPFSPLRRPPLDNPSVSPPVRIFARNSVENQLGHY